MQILHWVREYTFKQRIHYSKMCNIDLYQFRKSLHFDIYLNEIFVGDNSKWYHFITTQMDNKKSLSLQSEKQYNCTKWYEPFLTLRDRCLRLTWPKMKIILSKKCRQISSCFRSIYSVLRKVETSLNTKEWPIQLK